MPRKATTPEAEVKTGVEMADGKVVDFGKRSKALFNVSSDEGSVTLQAAIIDGTYGTYTLKAEDVQAWAEYGLRAAARAAGIDSQAAFEAASKNWDQGPFHTEPRSSKGPAPTMLELALAQVTGKPVDAIRIFLASKNRKEVFALKNDARIAPIYAALKAADDAEKAAKKAAKAGETPAEVDLLSELASDAKEGDQNADAA
jgi:hypothetical protein